MKFGSVAAGVLTLIVLETVSRRAADAGKGLDVLTTMLNRLLSPDQALIPRVKSQAPVTAPKGSGGTSKTDDQIGTLPRNPVFET